MTVADRESEHMLTEGLMSILPDARVVGEEACASDPRLLVGLDKGLVWIVDPLDGTANFAAGREPFGIIIALAYDGVTIAAWLFNPVTDQMCYAALGAGATMSTVAGPPRWLLTTPAQTRPIAALATQFMPEAMRNAVIEAASGSFDLRPIPRCAAKHYPLLRRGENHARAIPADVCHGIMQRARCSSLRPAVISPDGMAQPYRFHDEGLGILAASSRGLWEQAAYRLSDRCLSDVSARPETHHVAEL